MPVLETERTMQVTKLSPHIGAEVTGIDLRQPVSEETRRRLNAAVVEHIALVIRGQTFTAEQFLAAAALFGPPQLLENSSKRKDSSATGVDRVYMLSSRHKDKTGYQKKVGIAWHTDGTNLPHPQKYTTLYAVELPDSGGNTDIANTRAGYEALPDALKQRITGMKTANVHVGSAAMRDPLYQGMADNIAQQQREQPPPILQPLVRTHPDNGSKAIYFNPLKAENVVGMSPEDSQDLFEELLTYALKPEFIYSHKWQMGDMLIWDNRSALHKANFDFDPNIKHRTMLRIVIEGDLPV